MLGTRRGPANSAELWILVVLPFCVLTFGCPGNPPGDQGGTPLFSDEVVQTLRHARDDFRAKLEGAGFDQARSDLLLELTSTYPNIVSATLAEDQTTILMKMADGSLAALDTTDFSELWQDGDAQAAAQTRSALARQTPHAPKPRSTAWKPAARAANILTPTSRSALLITAAGITDPVAVETVEEARDTLIDHGWDPNDVTLLARTEAGTELTPEDFCNLGAYGLIILVGHGGWNYFDGVPLHYLQCCSNLDYSSIVGADRQAEYETWKSEGKMIIFTYADPKLEADAEDIYLRSDLLEAQVGSLPASHVHMLSCYSLAANHAFMGNDAGDFWGWSGQGPMYQGKYLIVRALEGMLADVPKTDLETADALDADRSFVKGSVVSRLKVRHWTAYNFYLPGWAQVTVDTATAPSGTAAIWIELTYSNSAFASLNVRELLADTPHEFPDVLPAKARFKLTAVDGAGKTLASGQETVQLHAGLNELDLEFCTAQARFSVSEYPRTGTPVASVTVQATHSDPTADPIPPFAMNPADTKTLEDLLVRELAVTAEARDGVGKPVGVSRQTFSLDCDENELELCFGWVKVHSAELPRDTAKVTVKTSFTDPVLTAPAAVEYAVGSSATIVGFRVGSEVTFTATAENAVGQELGTKTVKHVVACGENDVAIDFFGYGIILSASPTKVQANGFSTSVITATLKKLTATDLVVPTGDPVVGKSVEFDTSLGTIVTANPAVTGANGVATIELVSTTEGRATVRAFVTEDLVESGTVEVEFGDVAPPADELTVELAPAQRTLCMTEELTISASVSGASGGRLEYHWSASMTTDNGDHLFWTLLDDKGDPIDPNYSGASVKFVAHIWDEYQGHVMVSLTQFDADGNQLDVASDKCLLRVEACGSEIPITIEAVTKESSGLYCAYPRAAFVWPKVAGATHYLVALHPNKDNYEYGDGHYSNRGRAVDTPGNMFDVADGQAGYLLTSKPCGSWQSEPPDLSSLNDTLEYYQETYGSYTATVQPLYD